MIGVWIRGACWLCATAFLLSRPQMLRAAPSARGDVNCDGRVDAADIEALTAVLFGTAPDSCGSADVNVDGRISAADAVALVSAVAPPVTTPSRSPAFTRTPTATRTSTRTTTPTVTRTPTPTLSRGPQITFFGLASASGHKLEPIAPEQDPPVYATCSQPGSCPGAGFLIVIEAKPGSSGKPPGLSTFKSNPNDPTARPDLQLEANRDLGIPTRAVCDKGPAPAFPLGGVPAIDPPSFDPTSQNVADALNDLACRFDSHTSADPCTVTANDNPRLVDPTSTTQFCTAGVVGKELDLPNGDTTFTVQWRDMVGNLSGTKRIVVRVP